jgi:hypothetical protein
LFSEQQNVGADVPGFFGLNCHDHVVASQVDAGG